MSKKKISKKGYRMLAVVWTLAAASMAVAFVRYLPVEFNLFLLLMTALSMLTAANFWKAYRSAPKEALRDPFADPPKFSGRSVPFDDDPPPRRTDGGLNKHPEENDDER